MSPLLPPGTNRLLATCGAGLMGDALQRHQLLRVDLAAACPLDRSIDGLGAFFWTDVNGSVQLPQALRPHWEALPSARQRCFRLRHISTDEVFGSLGATGRFFETIPCDPRSSCFASKAACVPLVNAWPHTHGLPVRLTDCFNNDGPWQVPEKPMALHGDGAGDLGSPSDRTNRDVVGTNGSWIDAARITPQRDWKTRHSLFQGLQAMVRWCHKHLEWCQKVRDRAGYSGEPIGMQAAAAAAG